jgi:hypothetical protein
LVAGSPGERIAGFDNAGAAYVFYGGPGGLSGSGSQAWHQADVGVPGDPESGDHFGDSVTSGDLNNDSYDDLVVGGPGEERAGDSQAGAVWQINGTANGLDASGAQMWGSDRPTVQR